VEPTVVARELPPDLDAFALDEAGREQTSPHWSERVAFALAGAEPQP
jgi:hypothetical protein